MLFSKDCFTPYYDCVLQLFLQSFGKYLHMLSSKMVCSECMIKLGKCISFEKANAGHVYYFFAFSQDKILKIYTSLY